MDIFLFTCVYMYISKGLVFRIFRIAFYCASFDHGLVLLHWSVTH